MNESKQLMLSENPRSLRQNGAWFYLDKGRAWGLRLNDRLTSVENPEIKGHIVRFYGPESGIKNTQEETIGEGAIIFIREGLVKLKSGCNTPSIARRIQPKLFHNQKQIAAILFFIKTKLERI